MVDVGDGIRQAVVDEGPRDAPVTFLPLHGNPTWGFLYRRFITHLAGRGHRVVLPDHVGFGRSDKPRDPGYYTLERHVNNLEATLEVLEVRNVVPIMQDWGGPIGMGWATRHPDRIAGVVVLNTWAFVRDPPMKLPWIFRFLVLGRGGWRRSTQKNFFTESFLARIGTRRRLSEAELDAYRAPHPTPEDRIGIARFPQLIPQTRDRTHESWEAMARIEDDLPKLADKPALIVWALGDVGFRKPHMERWRRVFPRAGPPVQLPEAKHYLQEDAPEEILGAIDGWSRAALSKE